jgi:hypothetical protein
MRQICFEVLMSLKFNEFRPLKCYYFIIKCFVHLVLIKQTKLIQWLLAKMKKKPVSVLSLRLWNLIRYFNIINYVVLLLMISFRFDQ